MVRDIAVPQEVFLDEQLRASYKSIAFLGKGGFAHCYKVMDRETRRLYALKVVNKSRVEARQYAKMQREINVHKTMNHPNIVRLVHNFEDVSNMYMLMELCSERTLLGLIDDQKSGGLSEWTSRSFLRGIVSAVQYILSKKIIHRDIKPGNVLLSEGENVTVKLADFGLACHLSEVSPVSISGTPNYLAPEVLARRGHSSQSEAWSIGCLLYCMLIGRPPFDSNSLNVTYARISRAEYSYPSHIHLSPAAKKLIDGLLVTDPNERMTVEGIALSTFLQGEAPRREQPLLSRSRSGSGFETNKSGHDSGLGCESPFSYTDSFARMLRDVVDGNAGLVQLKSSECPLHVSKWVDYSNKYGFGAMFSDGSVSVLYNDNRVVAINRSGARIYSPDVHHSSPKVMDEMDEDARKAAHIAFSYRKYMDEELALAVREWEVKSNSDDPIPYLVHFEKDEHHLVMILSDGTCQVNFLQLHSKIVLWWDGGCRISLIGHTGDMCTFSIDHGKPFRVRAELSYLLRLSSECVSRVGSSFRPLRPPVCTDC